MRTQDDRRIIKWLCNHRRAPAKARLSQRAVNRADNKCLKQRYSWTSIHFFTRQSRSRSPHSLFTSPTLRPRSCGTPSSQPKMSSTSPVLTFAIRSTQALFAIVVFGLSTTLIRGHHLGSLPSTLGFVAFVGGLSFIGALLGIAAYWMQVLQGQIGVLMDAVIAGINLAGGIVSLMFRDSA